MNIEETINKIVDRVLNEELSKKIDDAVEAISEDMGKMPEDRDKFDGRDSEVVGVYDPHLTGEEEIDEEEVEEGNAFSAARAKAIEKGEDSFEVDGKTYPVEGEEDELNEDWDDAFLSIGDMGWHNRRDQKVDDEFNFDDYDEEDIDSYDDLMSMFGDKQRWFEPEGTNTLSIRDNGRGMFDMYKEKYGQPFKLRKRRPMGEEEIEEGPIDRLRANVAGTAARVGTSLKNVGAAIKGDKEAFKSPELQAGLARMKVKFNNFDKEVSEVLRDVEKLFPSNTLEKSPELAKIVSQYKELLQTVKNSNNNMKTLGESKKNVVALSESEMVELIQRLVMEEKEAKGLKDTEKVLKDSKKVNDEAMDAVNKKMKDYVKDGSEEAYTPDAEHFPQGNGELGETEKMAYTPSKQVEEFIEYVSRTAGQEDLDYDQIKPDEDWLEMNIMGSSKTGNSQEYANAVPTDVNKKINIKRKKKELKKLKDMAYAKAPQPVYDFAGNKTHNDSFAGLQTASIDEKKGEKINEDIDRMKSLLGHGYKTQ